MGGLVSVSMFLISILFEKGLIYLLSFVASYTYLTIRQILRKKRFDLYDWSADGQPEKNGFFLPKKEWEFDTPRKSLPLNKFSDDAYIFGTNSTSDCLAVRISRIPDNQVRCSVVLKLQNGRLYSLPKEHTIQKATDEDFTFGSSRLKLQCLLPMRRWRVFFNGILEECSEEEDIPNSQKYKHVKFTLLWVASTEVFDFSSDMSKTLLSHSAASATSWTTFPIIFLNKILSAFDRYEQGGMLHGTIRIGGEPENEIHLWGARGRFLGNSHELKNSNYMDACGNFKNGSVIHFGTLRIPGVIQQFVYGYVMKADGFVLPIEEFESKTLGSEEVTITKLHAYGIKHDVRIESNEGQITSFGKEHNSLTSVKIAKMFSNYQTGNGFIFNGRIAGTEHLSKQNYSVEMRSRDELNIGSLLTVPFKKKLCQSANLCGGKGSSLGKLFAIANQPKSGHSHSEFGVPNGIVVSTVSYSKFTRDNALQRELRKFEKDVWSKPQEEIPQLCQKTVVTVSKSPLPAKVKKSIESDLKEVFGDAFLDRKFAVRSSAIGEDTDQMSAAGQMETFLGLKGIDEIYVAVVKCWASQFTFQAVEYKRRYGQRLNAPMAVVIQEMVSCEVAGVIFTCDPVTGDPSFISITANWGLGESVVSASAEPDTITLERNIFNGLKHHSSNLGKKQTKTVMDDLGTKEVEVEENDSSICCITEAEAMKLGQISIQIENEYGSTRDLEWGIVEGNIILFQSRPVTTIDTETDFEAERYFDSAMRCEQEVISRAHVGEAMPGAMSGLGSDMMQKIMNMATAREFIRIDGGDSFPDKPYYEKGFVLAHSTLFFNLISGFFKFNEGNEEFTKAFVVAMFGRLIDDKEIREMSLERHSWRKPKFSIKRYLAIPYMFVMSYIFDIVCWWTTRNRKEFQIPHKGTKSAHETILQISTHYDKMTKPMNAHMYTTLSSTIWNSTLLTLLAKAEGDWDNKVYSDFAYLLSTCTQVESANVPASIQELAFTISKNLDPAYFKKLDVEDALKLLQSNSTPMGRMFTEFLRRHGHRCVKEFDIYSEVWKTNPRSLIRTLQEIVSENAKFPTEKKIDSFSVIISKLKVKLDFLERLRLRWALPHARRAVRWREHSKSFIVLLMNRVRKAFNHMAQQMVLEGRVPQKEYCFFLSVEDLLRLSKNRSPRLVAKAARRFKSFEKLDKLMFPEFITGVPKPANDEKIVTGKGYCMTGVPVSQGVVKARACVVKNFSEASNLRAGDIMITYSTDTAWSPYFPLLAGVVTELGGLVSHGAVVAREYGLPCVVALHGATRAFTSGDLVILDGNKGTLQKVEE